MVVFNARMAEMYSSGTQLTTEIKYSSRARRVILRVLNTRVLRVTAPKGTKAFEVEKIIQKNFKWILDKLEIINSLPKEEKITLITGQHLPFLGETLTLKVIDGKKSVERIHNDIIVSVPLQLTDLNSDQATDAYIQKMLVKWYKNQALEKIKSQVFDYTKTLNVHATSVTLKNYKSRWGSCSSKGELIFNWQMITFEKNIFNYVVAHEVCHLKEMNHSPKFYAWLQQLGFRRSEMRAQMKKVKNLF